MKEVVAKEVEKGNVEEEIVEGISTDCQKEPCNLMRVKEVRSSACGTTNGSRDPNSIQVFQR